MGPAIPLNAGARVIRREFQGNDCAAELPSPVSKPALERVSLKLFTLPDGIIGILDRKRLQSRVLPGENGFLKCCGFSDENVQRPSIGNNMVHGQQEQVVFGAEPKQARAQHKIKEGANDEKNKEEEQKTKTFFQGAVSQSVRLDRSAVTKACS